MTREEKQRVAAAVKARNKRALDRLNAAYDRESRARLTAYLDATDRIIKGHRAALARVERLP